MTALFDSLSGLVASFGPSILAKSTVVLLSALGAVRIAHASRASVRHLFLVAAFGVLLALPVAIAVAPSVRVDVAPVPVMFEEYLSEVVSLDDHAPVAVTSGQGSVSTTADRWNVSRLELLTVIWLAGAVVCAMPLLIGTLQVRRLRRTGLPWRTGQRLVDVLTREADLNRPIDVLLHPSIAAPATCGFRRHVVLFPINADTWRLDDTLRAAVHEVEHARRADCLVNVIARALCAAYWFHPLAWIAWRRLALEAERACDDAVLRRAAADAYADQLVTLAGQLTARARHPLLAMANRSDLVQRVRAVLDHGQARGHAGTTESVAIAIAASALAATLAPLQAVSPSSDVAIHQSATGETTSQFEVATLRANQSSERRARHSIDLTSTPWAFSAEALAPRPGATPPPGVDPSRPRLPTALREQLGLALDPVRAAADVLVIERVEPLAADSPAAGAVVQAPQQPVPAFEVVSIRRNTSGAGAPTTRLEGGRYIASNAALQQVISDAYRLPLVGGPEWIRSRPGPTSLGQTRFDIVATIPPGTPAAQVPLMVRTLLAERFNLVVHVETQQREVYALVHAREDKRLGPQLTRSLQQCRVEIEAGPLRAPVRRVTEDGKPLCSTMVGPAAIRGGGLTLQFLANAMTGFAGRMIVDHTGLEGPFDFELRYAPAAARGGGPPASDDRPSIFVAVQEQLGLKLEPTTALVEVLVVDTVSMPSEN